MSGIGLILNTAKDALLSQQIALGVVSQNVANVSTPGYTRQTAVLAAKDPAPVGGLVMGRGVDVEQIIRNSNSFIETRLQQGRSDLAALQEQETYMGTISGIFDESSGQSLGTQLSDFYNAWNDLANNPSGTSERDILYEKGALLTQAFKDHSADLLQVNDELNLSIDAGVKKVNDILSQIADLNPQIVSLKAAGNANDLLDKRDNLITQLGQYIDVKTYEDDNGNMTVTTGKGYTLVSNSDFYSLNFDGTRVMWEASGGNQDDITDTITGGKLGGWLEMRDRLLPTYEANLDELAKSIIWEVNKIHSQGVGLEPFSEVSATNAVLDPAAAMSEDNGLDYSDRIQTGSFSLWLYDPGGNVVGGGPTNIAITAGAGGTSLNDLIGEINGIGSANLSASESDGKLTVTASNGYTFAFSGDTSGALATLGINTFFTGDDATSMDMNTVLNSNENLIATGQVGASGEMAAGDNTNALAMVNLQNQDVAMNRYQYERGQGNPTELPVSNKLEDYLYTLVGSVGIKSQSITGSREYSEAVVNQLSQTRDNISAVSIDEEMTNLIKYQQAYAAAAKLISTADEMYQTLLDTKQS